MNIKDILDQKTFRILLMVIIIILPVYGIFVYASLQPGANSFVHFEEEMFYSKSVSSTNVTTITITSYITNEGISDSGEIKIKMFIEDRDGLSQSEAEKTIDSIPAHSTEEVLMDVVVEDSESYDVDTLLFEDDQRIVTNEGYFRTPDRPMTDPSSGGSFDTDEGFRSDDQKDYSSPGFEAVEIVLIVAILLIFFRVRRKRIKN
jgi:hypothetical protein